MTPAILLRDLTVSYRRHPALHHISGEFAAGSMTAIVGANGAGKSTLLKSILGLVRVDAGEVILGEPRSRIAYLPQQAEVDRNFPISVMDCVLMGDWRRSSIWHSITPDTDQRASAALAAVGLQGFEKRSIGTLSAGQFQRVLFARMIMQDAAIVLLDEPFNAIDERTTQDLLQIVCQWHQQGRTVIAVLHDNNLVYQYFPQTLLLARRVIAWGATDQALTEEQLQQARRVRAAWDPDALVCHTS